MTGKQIVARIRKQYRHDLIGAFLWVYPLIAVAMVLMFIEGNAIATAMCGILFLTLTIYYCIMPFIPDEKKSGFNAALLLLSIIPVSYLTSYLF